MTLEQIFFVVAIAVMLAMIRNLLLHHEILSLKRNKLKSPLDKYKLKYERTTKK